MSGAGPFEILGSGSCTDYHQILFGYLRLLGFDSDAMSAKYHTNFDCNVFRIPSRIAFEVVVHFLFKQLDPERTTVLFRDTWPIIDKKQGAQFRKIIHQWLTEIQEKNENFMHQHINPAVFLTPGGDKLVYVLSALAAHVVHKKLEAASVDCLQPPDWNQKLGANFSFTENVLASQIELEAQRLSDINVSFAAEYKNQKHIAETLVSDYRNQCKRLQETKERLEKLVERAAFSDSQKQDLFNSGSSQVVQELSEAVTAKEEALSSLWRTIDDSAAVDKTLWNIIESVLNQETVKATLDVTECLEKLPKHLIESYQSKHGGTKYELQYKEGKLELSSFYRLLLHAFYLEAHLIKNLNLPSFSDVAGKLEDQTVTLAEVTQLLEKVYERWEKLVAEQSQRNGSENYVLSDNAASRTIHLLPSTPQADVMDKLKDLPTPVPLQGALGMTPAITGARSKTSIRDAHKKNTTSRDWTRRLNVSSSTKNEPGASVAAKNPVTSQTRSPQQKIPCSPVSKLRSSPTESVVSTEKLRPVKKAIENSSKAEAVISDLSVSCPAAETQNDSKCFDARRMSASAELLQVLEDSFSAVTSETAAASTSVFSVHSQDVTLDGERGLLDFSYASMIDEMLDFSLSME